MDWIAFSDHSGPVSSEAPESEDLDLQKGGSWTVGTLTKSWFSLGSGCQEACRKAGSVDWRAKAGSASK